MFMPVLKKSESYRTMYTLLYSEVKEVEETILQYQVNGSPKNRDELVGELLDVIEVCIGFLDDLETKGANLELSSMEHIRKLINRKIWTIKKWIKIEVL